MNKENITSSHVAKLAGVSQSAVSRVFTEGASVSPKMAEKVKKAAAELGYRPNVLARSLITGRSNIIGLVVAYLENQFYPEAIEKLSNSLKNRGYHVLIFMSTLAADNIDQLLEELLDYQVDGIVIASASMSSTLATRCESAGVPVVLFNRNQEDERLSSVTSDNVMGGIKIAKFLIAGGHKKIAHIAGWEDTSTQLDREKGFIAGLHQAGYELYAREKGEYNFEKAQAATRRMFANKDRPDAVFVANDHMAMAVMDVLRFELDIKIPEDVSVIGYDDVTLAAWASFSLTTLRQPSNRMVEETVNILMSHIKDGDDKPRQVTIDGPLIVRKSARIPEGWHE